MEQTIQTAIALAKTSLTGRQALSPECQQKIREICQTYRSYEDFNIQNNPDTDILFASDERKAIMDDYSTLAMLDAALGNNTSSRWLVTLLASLNKFSGSKNMDDSQTESLARLIAREYSDMKYSVMMLFFYKFKIGHFGKFWGKVDPMVITCALKDFKNEIYMKRQELLTEGYMNKVDEEDKYREAVYKNWYNLCQELFSSVEAKDIDDLSSVDVKKIYVEEKCLEISLSKHQYELLKVTYNDLFSALKNRYLSNLIWKLRYKLNDKSR